MFPTHGVRAAAKRAEFLGCEAAVPPFAYFENQTALSFNAPEGWKTDFQSTRDGDAMCTLNARCAGCWSVRIRSHSGEDWRRGEPATASTTEHLWKTLQPIANKRLTDWTA